MKYWNITIRHFTPPNTYSELAGVFIVETESDAPPSDDDCCHAVSYFGLPQHPALVFQCVSDVTPEIPSGQSCFRRNDTKFWLLRKLGT